MGLLNIGDMSQAARTNLPRITKEILPKVKDYEYIYNACHKNNQLISQSIKCVEERISIPYISSFYVGVINGKETAYKWLDQNNSVGKEIASTVMDSSCRLAFK
jgi:hypothetical protein